MLVIRIVLSVNFIFRYRATSALVVCRMEDTELMYSCASGSLSNVWTSLLTKSKSVAR